MARPREQRTRAGLPLYTADWNVLAHKRQPPHCNLPKSYSSIPVPKLSPFHPVLYQNFVPPAFRSFYPFEAMNFREIFSPYVSGMTLTKFHLAGLCSSIIFFFLFLCSLCKFQPLVGVKTIRILEQERIKYHRGESCTRPQMVKQKIHGKDVSP